jgi:hypothetical protein
MTWRIAYRISLLALWICAMVSHVAAVDPTTRAVYFVALCVMALAHQRELES